MAAPTTSLDDVRLHVFLTANQGLADWQDNGSLQREVAVYRRLLPHLAGVVVHGYGDAGRDRRIAADVGLDSVTVRPGRLGAFRSVTAASSVGRHAIFKCNQVRGGGAMLAAASLNRAPSIARCGYLLSDFTEREHGMDSRDARLARARERVLFRRATRAVVTTRAMARRLEADYGVTTARVIPNYVDTDVFAPVPEGERQADEVVAVGRLHTQKRLDVLIRSLAGTGLRLTVVGAGPEESALRALATSLDVDVTFLGRRPTAEVAAVMARAGVYVLCSDYEGHPKTLLEAMSTGAPVVVTDVPGITGHVADQRDGLVVPPGDPNVLREAVVSLAEDRARAARLGAAARERAQAEFSLDRVVEMELELLRELAR